MVVNHALLLADQALESKILPEYDDLIVDETHHLEDVATRQLGANIEQQELLNSLAALSQQQGAGRYAGLVSRAHATLISAARGADADAGGGADAAGARRRRGGPADAGAPSSRPSATSSPGAAGGRGAGASASTAGGRGAGRSATCA